MKQSIIGGDLNLPQVDWKDVPEGISVAQAYINRLVWDNGYMQVVEKRTRGDSLLDVYLVKPESELISCDTIHGISDHYGVLLEMKWEENGFVTHEKRSVPAYHKTNVVGLQSFIWDKLPIWANNGSWVEDIWNNFKGLVFEGIERFVPHKILKQNPDPEYYNKEVKRLKVKLAYTSLVRPILEYGAGCWDPYRECQITALDRVQNKAAKFAHYTGGSVWESLAQRRMTARMCALYKGYNGDRAWKDILSVTTQQPLGREFKEAKKAVISHCNREILKEDVLIKFEPKDSGAKDNIVNVNIESQVRKLCEAPQHM
ncbi:hypothetical protein B7P43_G18087 [Cryptotermes secundus]|uniref:Endonuclease/exonuclease/phosphatase domain-containing protein n=1 Tax=Cryptotermes secundus TaxID=105785 RepID=A0A2J7Q2P6_9NEOP|nr:hypothetical protein B7P43_G18087 [Cryptotermes secundus]